MCYLVEWVVHFGHSSSEMNFPSWNFALKIFFFNDNSPTSAIESFQFQLATIQQATIVTNKKKIVIKIDHHQQRNIYII